MIIHRNSRHRSHLEMILIQLQRKMCIATNAKRMIHTITTISIQKAWTDNENGPRNTIVPIPAMNTSVDATQVDKMTNTRHCSNTNRRNHGVASYLFQICSAEQQTQFTHTKESASDGSSSEPFFQWTFFGSINSLLFVKFVILNNLLIHYQFINFIYTRWLAQFKRLRA